MTQSQLARAVNTSERNIVRWENDQNRPRLEHISAIAEVTGADLVELMNGDQSSDEDDEESRAMPTLDDIVRRRVRQIVRDELQAART